MRILVIIPAFNEEETIGSCLDSFIAQSTVPDKLLVVDDGSTDQTALIVAEKSKAYSWISLVKKTSKPQHQPGAKVVQCFNYGLEQVEKADYDLIGKFDADLILPKDYFKTLHTAFKSNPKLGLAGGLLFIKKHDAWIYEKIAEKSHIRGPVKLYRRECFDAIGGLRETIGWDTMDVLLAEYHGFHTATYDHLEVKHLRPTGGKYRPGSKGLKGKALFKMRYGIALSLIASLKMSWNAGKPGLFFWSVKGFLTAALKGEPFAVNPEEGKFIRALRWRGIRKKLF